MPDRLLDPGADVRDQRQGFMNLLSIAASMAIVALIVLALYVLRDILMPLTLAALLSFVLAPLVSRLVKWRVPRGVAVPMVVVAAFTALGLLGYVFVNQVTQLAAELPSYQQTLRQKVSDLKGGAKGGVLQGAVDVVQGLVNELNVTPDAPPAPTPPATSSTGAATGPLASPSSSPAQPTPRPVPVKVVDSETPLAALAAVITPLLHPLATTLMIVVFVAFILLQRDDIRNRFVKLAGGRDLPRTTAALNDAAKRLSKLFATQLMLNSAFGVMIGIGLWAIGVPNAILWAVTAAVMRFVPYIGALISAVLPLTMALAVDPGWTMAFWVALLFLVTDPLIGHVVEPLLLGRTTGLSPVAVVVSATFWTWLWGPIGLILATPMTVVLVVLGKHIEGLSFIDTLLGDEPALTETELFYQRMLAGDTLETTAQIEAVGERNGLLDYYDDVVIAGLRMAQADLERGRLEAPRVRRMRQSVAEMFEGIDEDMLAASRLAALKEDAEKRAAKNAADEEAARNAAAGEDDAGRAQGGKAAQKKAGKRKGEEESAAVGARPLVRLQREDLDEAWRGETPVVVIGGRGALDDAAAEPLADALHRSGLGARAMPAEALRGAGLSEESMRDVRMAFLSFLDASADSPMRFAVRRLRVRAPQAKIVLCVWSDEPDKVDVEALARATQADFVATRVREAHQIATLAAVGGGLLDAAAVAPAPTAAREAARAAQA